ncbi:sphingomyelin phosphodiesterase-like [Leptinotarsa decemlineata]|uniref:sphingomyelin phosphodiesterase-like n=1 Tax=Leptinotarsa decemlineata TaxID=7539 RepID=UPI003D309998
MFPNYIFLFAVTVLLVFTRSCYTLNEQDFDDDNAVKIPLWERIFRQFQQQKKFSSGLGEVSMNVNQTCTLCHLMVDTLIFEMKNEMTLTQLIFEIEYFCSILNIEKENVCEGVITLNADILTYIVKNQTKIDGTKICALILQSIGCEKGNNYEWEIEIPPGNTVKKPKPDGKTKFNILHLTDLHYDPLYTENKTKDCGEPLCCQNDQKKANNASDACGYWSSPENADVPLHTIEAMLNQTQSHEFEYVYFTGDMVSHRVWDTSVESNKKIITEILDQFVKYYKKPVYPVLGNHEAHPVNVFSPDEINGSLSTQWLYDMILEKWSWLPKDEVKDTILKGGYYTVLAQKGLRIVVLNNNVCSTENWWLIYDDRDPYGQLKWLAEVLHKAENNEEIVHILAHIPTKSCLKVWAREYRKIIERFSNTVAAQFYGHTHRDQIHIYYNNKSEAMNVGWNGGSLMPDEANPNYKLYTIDAKVFDVLDAETWTFNLTLANEMKEIKWKKLYSFKEAYGMDGLLPANLDELVRNMASNDTFIELYNNFYYRDSDYDHTCDEACKMRLLCEMVTTEQGKDEVCEELKEIRQNLYT